MDDDIFNFDWYWRRYLRIAVENGDLEFVVDYLRERPFLVDTRDKYNCTLLMLASVHGHTDMARYLLERGADVTATDCQGKSALIYAADHGHNDIVQMLLLKDTTNIDHQDRAGVTALSYAARCHAPGDNTEVINTLLRFGANYRIRDNEGNTILHWALTCDNEESSLFQFILDSLAISDRFNNLANIPNAAGLTPLMLALRENNKSAFCVLLLEHNADVGRRDNNRRNALMHAAYQRYLDTGSLVELCYRTQEISMLNAQDLEGNTALMLATRESYLNFVKILLQHGADVHLRNNRGETAVTIAVRAGRLDIAACILRFCSDTNECRSKTCVQQQGVDNLQIDTAMMHRHLAALT